MCNEFVSCCSIERHCVKTVCLIAVYVKSLELKGSPQRHVNREHEFHIQVCDIDKGHGMKYANMNSPSCVTTLMYWCWL